jgi:hypothetical protein
MTINDIEMFDFCFPARARDSFHWDGMVERAKLVPASIPPIIKPKSEKREGN